MRIPLLKELINRLEYKCIDQIHKLRVIQVWDPNRATQIKYHQESKILVTNAMMIIEIKEFSIIIKIAKNKEI